MRRALPKAVVAIGVIGLIACGTAYALRIQIGNLEVRSSATVVPHTLPEHTNAPATVNSLTRIETSDGSAPPALRKLLFIFDKHGSIDTAGLPVCTMAKLAETTTAAAKAKCPGAIVGEGLGRGIVTLPGQEPIAVSSPIVMFNAPPEGGKPSLIAHAYETVPAPKALLAPFSVERIQKGRYGYQVEIQMPEIAEGYGSITLAKASIGHEWKAGGKTHSYVNARCEGGRLQVHGSLNFQDGGFFQGTLAQSCAIRG
jgi:hypothetical protein